MVLGPPRTPGAEVIVSSAPVDGTEDWAEDAADDDESLLGLPLPPDDRLWRHPTELALAGVRPPPGRRGSLWPVAVGSGLLGSVLTCGPPAAMGVLGGGQTTVVREREALPRLQTALFGGDMQDATGVERIAADARASIPRIEVD